MCLAYKFIEYRRDPVPLKTLFLKNLYRDGSISTVNLVHLFFRALNFFVLSLLIIYASAYAQLAQINFGIIVCCLSISSPINCLCGFLFWGERLTAKTMIGTAAIVTGVAWVALAKNPGETAAPDGKDDISTYRLLSISLALLCGLLGSVRVQQAKLVHIKY